MKDGRVYLYNCGSIYSDHLGGVKWIWTNCFCTVFFTYNANAGLSNESAWWSEYASYLALTAFW